MMRQLDQKVFVSGQIRPEDVAGLREQGIAMVINNRPDGEEPGQPPSAELEAAAEAAGLDYRHIPIARGLGPAEVEEMQSALSELGDGKLLAFCRSGMRSTLAWAVARRDQGVPREELDERAHSVGFNLTAVDHLM